MIFIGHVICWMWDFRDQTGVEDINKQQPKQVAQTHMSPIHLLQFAPMDMSGAPYNQLVWEERLEPDLQVGSGNMLEMDSCYILATLIGCPERKFF